VARLDIQPMRRGQTTSGDATGGSNRPKSGKLESIAGADSKPARNSVAPSSVTDAGIDADGGAPESNRAWPPVDSKLAPARVISIGPPNADAASSPAAASAQPPLNNRPEHVASASSAPSVASDLEALAAPKAVSSEEVKKLLTEGPQTEFSPLDIAQLVTSVMGSQPPPPNEDSPSNTVRPKSLPPAEIITDDDWDVPSRPVTGSLSSSSVVQTVSGAGAKSGTPTAESPQGGAQAKAAISSRGAKEASVHEEAKPSSTRKNARKKQAIAAKKKQPEAAKPEAAKLEAAGEHGDAEWTGEFFAINPDTFAHDVDLHENEEIVDELRLRSLRPEVLARRARYRWFVLGLVLGMILLLAAAVTLKMLRHH